MHQQARSYEEDGPLGITLGQSQSPWLKEQQEINVKETALYVREGWDATSLTEPKF